jgi:hypothetical protein
MLDTPAKFITLYRIETFCGLVWTGKGFSYDAMDAEPFDTEAEALEAASDLADVFVEKFQMQARPLPDLVFSVPASTVFQERRSA